MADLLTVNGILITGDLDRRVIENGAVAVQGDRIIGVGPTKDILPRNQARCKRSLPEEALVGWQI